MEDFIPTNINTPTPTEFNPKDMNNRSEFQAGKSLFVTVFYPDPTTVSNYTGGFFIAPARCYIVKAYESHNTAGTGGGAQTLDIVKVIDGQAAGAGVSMIEGTFDLKGTANTVQTKNPRKTTTTVNRNLEIGDRLATTSGATTPNGVGVSISVELRIY